MPARRSSHTLFNLPAWALVGLIVISGSGFMSINSTNFDPAHDCPDCQVQFDPDNPDHYGLWGPYWHLTVKDGYMGCSGYGCILYEQQKDTYEPNGGDCGTCEGKVTGLTLQYLGEAPAQISILQKKGPTVYDELVTPGWAFSIDGVDKHDTLGTEISIYVDGELNTRIHTSCSMAIGPGMVSGDFVVVDGDSRRGGSLCPIAHPPGDDDDDDDDGDDGMDCSACPGSDDDIELVSICHKPGTPAQRILTIPTTALPGHLGHGDVLGACPADDGGDDDDLGDADDDDNPDSDDDDVADEEPDDDNGFVCY